MKLRIFTLIIFVVTLAGASLNSLRAQDVSIMDIETKAVPSDAFISSHRSTISAEQGIEEVRTLSSPAKTMNRGIDMRTISGWENPLFPGGDGGGWETGPGGNVGMGDLPLGDASLPILISMLVLYFLYRGVSSSKRKSSF